MDLTIAGTMLSGYLLALARTAGFILMAPPFNTRAFPAQARGGLALALAIPLATWTTPTAPALGSNPMIGQMLLQILMGVTLGFFVQLAVAAIQTVGDLIDVAGGFSISIGNDPLLLVQSSVMGRLHQLTAVTLLFVGEGHLIILQGLSRSLQLMPTPALNLQTIAGAVTNGVAEMFVSAVQITAPILAALLIADIALGLLTRAAPALNAFALAFPLKIMLSLLLIGLILTQLPGSLSRLIAEAASTMLRLSGG
ncbi:MAG TPA: flagellar biosynthetic protein FliR [Kineosporiaceae bacterium]|nr:flagellar biosynthetic protein FliR [Kineosporiaceae bacterium]